MHGEGGAVEPVEFLASQRTTGGAGTCCGCGFSGRRVCCRCAGAVRN